MAACLRVPKNLHPTVLRLSTPASQPRYASTSSGTPESVEAAPTQTHGRRKRRLFDRRLALPEGETYPNILGTDSILDAFSHPKITAGGETVAFDKRITFFNSPPPFPRPNQEQLAQIGAEALSAPRPPIPINGRHVYPIINKRVVQQTGKGKIASQYVGVIVGNGNGLVGYGSAKGDGGEALKKATEQAMRSADAVERFEGRTIWTEMKIKFGSTQIVLRPRPRGFGLACNPYLHQVSFHVMPMKRFLPGILGI